MRTIVRRSLQAALFTGGLVLVGVGTADADTGTPAVNQLGGAPASSARPAPGAATPAVPVRRAGVGRPAGRPSSVERTATARQGSLAYTGLDLLLLLAVGLLTLVAGSVLLTAGSRRTVR